MKRHSTTTLMGMTKAELVEYVRMCEHNREVAEQTLAQHFENVKDWEPVRQSEWKEWYPPMHMVMTGEERLYVCSNCTAKYSNVEEYRYCPNCGSRMDLGGADNG